ncbi:MAG: radical SAM protein [Candidatus Omnitrophica bacterium]|nr:radical SAM protein [Candidatus Omnitrophota bacterium]
MKKLKYIYGPVASWRLGRSLGVDPLSGKNKVCTFNCTYCQVGKTRPSPAKRKVFVSTKKLLNEIGSLKPLKIDYITFSGMGEPTLAKNLGQIIKTIKRKRKEKIAIFTNASLISKKAVQKDLMLADFVSIKLDAHNEKLFRIISKPSTGIRLKNIIKGIKEFQKKYKGKLALQVMFTHQNKRYAKELAELVKDIDPDKVQINTPLRPSGSKPLSKKEINSIKKCFKGLNIASVYDKKRRRPNPISRREVSRRRGKL